MQSLNLELIQLDFLYTNQLKNSLIINLVLPCTCSSMDVEVDVLTRRIALLERSLHGADARSLRALLHAEKRLQRIVPSELTDVLQKIRSCKAALTVDHTSSRKPMEIVTEAVEGLSVVDAVAIDVDALSCVSEASPHIENLTTRAVRARSVVRSVQDDVDALLVEFNNAVASANAAVLRMAVAVRALEES